MSNQIQTIAIDKLVANPDNPNRMSRTNFKKLIRNIERTGRYEPLVVRPAPQKPGFYQIINGHHRWRALKGLGYKSAEAVVWDIDDKDTDILLVTLNRLGGSDVLEKKLVLIKRLNQRMEKGRLAKLLPQTAKQIERLAALKMPKAPAKAAKNSFANPMVFFLNDTQQEIVENALLHARQIKVENAAGAKLNAVKKAEVLTDIAQYFLNKPKPPGQHCKGKQGN